MVFWSHFVIPLDRVVPRADEKSLLAELNRGDFTIFNEKKKEN